MQISRMNRTRNSVGRLNVRRRDRAFSPLDIAGLQLWLDFADASTLFTDAGITPVSADGDAIYQANDKSGNGNHTRQTLESNQPKYKINIRNTLSAGWFEDRGRLLKNVSSFNFNIPTTTIVVASFGGGDVITDMGKNRMSLRQKNVYSGMWGTGYTSVRYRSVILTGCFNTPNVRVYQNGNIEHDAPAGTSSSEGIGIGARHDLYNGGEGITGYFYEVLFYNQDLSDTDRQAVEVYLNNKWAIY